MPPIISARTTINVSEAQARDWFLALKDYPERYQFSTHEGFEFVEGDFGRSGARFKTRERFFFLTLELLFELTEVTQTRFRFELVRPSWLNVWGAFVLEDSTPGSIVLRLEIGSTQQSGATALNLYPVQAAIRQQISGEVTHIKHSMETLYQGG
jgi:hypothetical protein